MLTEGPGSSIQVLEDRCPPPGSSHRRKCNSGTWAALSCPRETQEAFGFLEYEEDYLWAQEGVTVVSGRPQCPLGPSAVGLTPGTPNPQLPSRDHLMKCGMRHLRGQGWVLVCSRPQGYPWAPMAWFLAVWKIRMGMSLAPRHRLPTSLTVRLGQTHLSLSFVH